MVCETEKFEILEKHKQEGVKLLKISELETQTKMRMNNLSLSDFIQGELGDCGLVATCAALSQRTEFSEEIAPVIDDSSGCMKLHFKMYYEGEPVMVTIDDALPIDENNALVYARSAPRNRRLCLSSYFEKVFVKQACYNSYKWAKSTRPEFVFSSFSNNMTYLRTYDIDESKETVLDCLGFELDNKSSLLIGTIPAIDNNEPYNENSRGHWYVVIGYSSQQKTVKLYDSNLIDPHECCVSNMKSPPTLTMNADSKNGEFWVSMDQLENKQLDIVSLYSNNMYKSVFQFKQKVKPSEFDENNLIGYDVCKFKLEDATTLMINFFSYTHEFDTWHFEIRTDDEEREIVELNYELPHMFNSFYGSYRQHGEIKSQLYQRFKLEPNTYVFSLCVEPICEGVIEEEVSILMKIGSVSECTFEELNTKNKEICSD